MAASLPVVGGVTAGGPVGGGAAAAISPKLPTLVDHFQSNEAICAFCLDHPGAFLSRDSRGRGVSDTTRQVTRGFLAFQHPRDLHVAGNRGTDIRPASVREPS